MEQKPTIPEVPAEENGTEKGRNLLAEIYDIVEMLGFITIVVMLLFAFVVRLNIVDGHSMDMTLAHGEYLVVSDLFYTPKPGDIVVIHDQSNGEPYTDPIVKRVIALGGQTVDIDFTTWTLTVDGEVVEEPYRYLDPTRFLAADYKFPITVPEGEIFVLGDNRHGSADSRQSEIGTIDERCVVGKAVARLFPLNRINLFQNPYES